MTSHDPPLSPVEEIATFMNFCAQEFQGFFAHISEAVGHYVTERTLPEPIFKPGSKPGLFVVNGHEGRRKGFKKDGTRREKRAPTAYNKFMAEKMGELKAKGIEGDQLFAAAVGEWKKLSYEQKSAITEAYKGAVHTNGVASPAAPANLPKHDEQHAAGVTQEPAKKKKRKQKEGDRAVEADETPAKKPKPAEEAEEGGDVKSEKKKKKKKKDKQRDKEGKKSAPAEASEASRP